MSVKVVLGAALAERAEGRAEFEFPPGSLAEILSRLCTAQPRLKALLWHDERGVNPAIALFLDGKQVDGDPPNLLLAMDEGGELLIVPALEGG